MREGPPAMTNDNRTLNNDNFFTARISALDPARAATAKKLLHFFQCRSAEVSWNRVLEATRRNCKVERGLVGRQHEPTIDDARSESVPATNAVNDRIDFVFAPQEELTAIVQTCRPAIG